MYHGLGTGKTCSAIAITEGFKYDGKIVVFVPGQIVQNNFMKELEKCGDKYYSPQRKHWVFHPLTINNEQELKKIIPSKTLHKLDGGWIANTTQSANYSKLSKKQQTQIKEQIHNKIESIYSVYIYSGLSRERLEYMKRNSVLNNTVVVIDEAHNVISMMTNYITNPQFK